MATVIWTGQQIARAWQKTLTVNTADNTNTITLTGGGSQAVVLTPTTTNTTTTAGEIVTALQNAGGVFSDLSLSSSGAVVTIVGPADGAPVTFSKSDGGTNSTTLTTVFAPKSPFDMNDGVNYSTGSLPSGSDTLVFENSAVDAKYNCDALASITLTAVIRRPTYTGRIGLPTTNGAGYPEYRVTEFQYKSATLTFEGSAQDYADQFRLKAVLGTANTVVVTGPAGNAQLGSESLVLWGTPASSTLTITGGSISVAPFQAQTGIFSAVNALNAVVSIGATATLSGTVRLDNCLARVKTSWSTSLTVDGQSQVEVAGSAAGTLILDNGYTKWDSTGNPGNSPIIGSGATLDLETAPAALSIGGTIALYGGGALLDGSGRGGNYAVQLVRATLAEVTLRTVSNKTFTLS